MASNGETKFLHKLICLITIAGAIIAPYLSLRDKVISLQKDVDYIKSILTRIESQQSFSLEKPANTLPVQ